MLANSVGIIDPDYRGEIKACLFNRSDKPITIAHGMKIVQAVFMPFVSVVVDEREVNATVRGDGGFGSTGS
jgi:dUTP pyrophosphatase